MRALVRCLGIAATLALPGTPAWAQDAASIQSRYCAGFPQNRTIKVNGGLIDCLSPTHAIEVNTADHWAEALGEALYLASQTQLAVGLILVCERAASDNRCLANRLRLDAAVAHQRFRLTVWECDEDDATLADCRRRELGDVRPGRLLSGRPR